MFTFIISQNNSLNPAQLFKRKMKKAPILSIVSWRLFLGLLYKSVSLLVSLEIGCGECNSSYYLNSCISNNSYARFFDCSRYFDIIG